MRMMIEENDRQEFCQSNPSSCYAIRDIFRLIVWTAPSARVSGSRFPHRAQRLRTYQSGALLWRRINRFPPSPPRPSRFRPTVIRPPLINASLICNLDYYATIQHTARALETRCNYIIHRYFTRCLIATNDYARYNINKHASARVLTWEKSRVRFRYARADRHVHARRQTQLSGRLKWS